MVRRDLLLIILIDRRYSLRVQAAYLYNWDFLVVERIVNHKTIIYLVRHGQTEWNLSHKMQGHQDLPLTSLGVIQAEALKKAMNDVHIDVVMTSTSMRAVKTTEILTKDRDICMIKSDHFREICLGIWEGRSQWEIEEEYPDQYHLFWNDPEKFSVEGSETLGDVARRALRELHHFLSIYRGKSLLIVSHTVLIKVLMSSFEGRPYEDLWDPPFIQPASLCQVEIVDDRPSIILYGDTSHYGVIERGTPRRTINS